MYLRVPSWKYKCWGPFSFALWLVSWRPLLWSLQLMLNGWKVWPKISIPNALQFLIWSCPFVRNVGTWNFSLKGHLEQKVWRRVLRTTCWIFSLRSCAPKPPETVPQSPGEASKYRKIEFQSAVQKYTFENVIAFALWFSCCRPLPWSSQLMPNSQKVWPEMPKSSDL